MRIFVLVKNEVDPSSEGVVLKQGGKEWLEVFDTDISVCFSSPVSSNMSPSPSDVIEQKDPVFIRRVALRFRAAEDIWAFLASGLS